MIELTHFEVKFIYGAAGELSVLVLRADDEFEVIATFSWLKTQGTIC